MISANARQTTANRWTLAVFLTLTAGMSGLLGRVVYLQASPPPQLVAQMSERASVAREPGRRGDLLDRRGRLLASTRFGSRVVVDPAEFPKKNIDKHLIALAEALGQPLEKVAPRIVNAMAENERRETAFKESRVIEPVLTDEEKAAAVLELTNAEAETTDDGALVQPVAALIPKAVPTKPRLIRYVVMSEVLDDARVAAVKKAKIAGVVLETRPVRELADPDIAAAMVGKVGFDGSGALAAEKMLNAKLEPTDGSFKYVRDARGQALWVEPGAYVQPQRGEDIRLSIDMELQRILVRELTKGVQHADAQGGRAILVDSLTGEILAMADVIRRPRDVVDYDWKTPIPKDKRLDGPRYATVFADPARDIHPALAHNRVLEDLYEPGSTFKPFMWAAATQAGVASPGEVLNTHWGAWATPYGRPIKDVVKRAEQTWTDVLVNSSNIGMVQVTARLTFDQMHDAVVKFGFGKRTGLGVPGEAAGIVTPMKRWSKYTQTSVAFGHEVAVTPMQMARGFCVFARPGDLAGTLPDVRLIANVSSDGTSINDPGKRVLDAKTAALTRETLRGVTRNLDDKLAHRDPPETGWRYELFGKSGTADIPMTNAPEGKTKPKGSDGYFRGQYNATFVAAGPVENPRLVCVVVIDDPGREQIKAKAHYGSVVAGPIVRRVMDQSLAYLGVPASLTPTSQGPAHASE